MSESLKNLASSTGVDADTVEKMLGGVLAFLKPRLGDETYATIESKVPEARRLVTDFNEAEARGGEAGDETGRSMGDLLGQVTALAGKVLGGESGGGDLLTRLIKLGLPVGSITALLPQIFKFLSEHLPADVLKQIAAALPAVPGVDAAALLGASGAALADTGDYPEAVSERP